MVVWLRKFRLTPVQKWAQKWLQRQMRAIAALLVLGLLVLGCVLGPIAPVLAVDYTNVQLMGADFSGQDLTDSTFVRANFTLANLSGANLQGVQLFSANLSDTNLSGADLRNAVLDKTKIRRTNFTNALLEGATAININIRPEFPPVIDGADFTDALLDDRAVGILCTVAKGTNPVTGRSTRETLFCD